MYLSRMWLGVALRTNTKMTCVYKRLDCILKNVINILSSTVIKKSKTVNDHYRYTSMGKNDSCLKPKWLKFV